MLEPDTLYFGVVTAISQDEQSAIVTWMLTTPPIA
jgi:hypothetical protein